MSPAELKRHIETIEESYEFFLAYAAQGATDDAASRVGAQLRQFLGQMDGALEALATDLGGLPESIGEPSADATAGDSAGYAADGSAREAADACRAMVDVTMRDAARARAVVRLVLAQPSIGSELIDNLNASLHIRTLLTDLFLLDEVT